MKLIENPEYFSVQITWFNTQISRVDSDVWSDRYKDQEKISAIAKTACNYYSGEELEALRAFLNETGLKRLNNSISAYKKRQAGRKKPVQLSLLPKTAEKLSKLASDKKQTISEYVEEMVSKKRL